MWFYKDRGVQNTECGEIFRAVRNTDEINLRQRISVSMKMAAYTSVTQDNLRREQLSSLQVSILISVNKVAGIQMLHSN